MSMENNFYTNYLSKHSPFNSKQPIKEKIEWIKYNFLKHYDKPDKKDLRYLDIGPGLGETLLIWKELGIPNMESIDISPEVVGHIQGLGFKSQVCDVNEYLKKNKETFDFINLNDVVEHVPNNQLFNLSVSLFDALKENGKVLIKVPNGQSPFCGTALYSDITHVQSFTENSFTQFWHNGGFTIFEFYAAEQPVDFKNPVGVFSKYFFMPIFFYLVRLARTYTFHLNPKILTEAIVTVATKRQEKNI